MPQRAKIVTAEDVLRGDVIASPSGSRLEMVHTVMFHDGVVCGFKVIPIFIHSADYWGEKSRRISMITKDVKADLGLDPAKQYRIDFHLEDRAVSDATEPIFHYARTAYTTHFGNATLAHMDRIIWEDKHSSSTPSVEEKVFTFSKRKPPDFVLEMRKPSQTLQLDVTLRDAVELGILNQTVHDLLKAGANSRQGTPTLRDLFTLAASEKNADQARLGKILEMGLKRTNVSLDAAFDAGLLDETASFEIWEKNGVTSLAEAQKAIARRASFIEDEDIDPYDIEHIEENPLDGLKVILKQSWERLTDMAGKRDPKLTQSGIPYMYPV